MKICVITDLFGKFNIGGAEIVSSEQAFSLSKKHKVILINSCGTKPKVNSVKGVKVYSISPSNVCSVQTFLIPSKTLFQKLREFSFRLIDFWNPFVYFKLKRIFESEKPDVIHVNNFAGFSLAVFSAAKSLEIPVVHTVYDYYWVDPLKGLLRNNKIKENLGFVNNLRTNTLNLFSKNISLVIFVSLVLGKKNKELGAFKHSKTTVLYTGVTKVKSAVKKSNQVVFAGGIANHKGLDILLDAWGKGGFNGVKLIVYGRGKMPESPKNVIFKGFVKEEKLIKSMQKSLATIVPSIWFDPLPIVALRSLSVGTPVIASRIGGLPEIIESGYDGELFRPGNSKELAQKIKKLLSNKKLLKIYSENAFESSKRFESKKMIKNLEKLYASVLSETSIE